MSENQDNIIYFNAREWSVCQDRDTVAERTFVTDFENNLSEAYCIGEKSQPVSEIATKQLVLSKNTKYTFYFWIKSETNPKYDSSCQLQIIYNGDTENKRVYVLSNTNIKPAKTAADGWKLYEIPFVTEENEFTQLKFSAKYASCKIIPGKEKKYYTNIPDVAEIPYYEAETKTETEEDTTENNAFKNISDSLKDFFGQFDGSQNNNNSETASSSSNDPFAAFNDFAKQMKKEIQREVNRNVRKDVYTDIKNMKDEIVNEIKNTFNSGNDNK